VLVQSGLSGLTRLSGLFGLSRLSGLVELRPDRPERPDRLDRPARPPKWAIAKKAVQVYEEPPVSLPRSSPESAMNGASGFHEGRSALSRSPSYRFPDEHRHRFGTDSRNHLRTHNLITCSTDIGASRETVPDTISLPQSIYLSSHTQTNHITVFICRRTFQQPAKWQGSGRCMSQSTGREQLHT
jgi:hypothetical protein